MEDSSEVSYCDKESWEEWGSRSSLSQQEELGGDVRCDADLCALRAERDGLARALAAERARATAAARAHDARLAELHGVIAELVRRRDARPAIPEEATDCDSAGGSAPADTDDSLSDHLAGDRPEGAESSPPPPDTDRADTSRSPRSPTERLLPPSPGRCEAREAKVATRVRLRRCEPRASSDAEARCVAAAERLARAACADDGADETCGAVWRARAARLAADCRVLECALARALDTAQRLSRAVAVQESSSVALCGALRAADRALETYDVLLALAETRVGGAGRAAAESVARRLLARLEAAPAWGEPLLSPGPWHELAREPAGAEEGGEEWGAAGEERLRAHAARLKRDTVALRALRPPPRLYSPGDGEEPAGGAAEMEAAVLMQEVLQAREARAQQRAAAVHDTTDKQGSGRRRRHWLEPAAETDL